MSKWIVVSDFDGTLTQKDIGNELCKIYIPEKFEKLHKEYKAGAHTLKSYQEQIWNGFPCTEEQFREGSLRLGTLRPGVNEFLEKCASKKIPVYVASCGMDAYIQPVLDEYLSDFAKAAIKGLTCNKVKFDNSKIIEFKCPNDSPGATLPLHKGEHALELKEKEQAQHIAAYGNGRSDRSFIKNVDILYATEGLLEHCQEIGQETQKSVGFSDFRDLYNSEIFE